MKSFRQAMMLAGAATVLLVPLAFAQATDAEFKCEAKATAASTKFVGAKAKCVMKCLQNFWKGLNPDSDCLPPYGGATATCVADPIKSAEQAFSLAVRKSCDPTLKATLDCPECYNGGDCNAYSVDYPQTIEGQVDSFVPGVGCERADATPAEQKCQLNTAKALTKQTAGVVKCYIKCETNAHKGLVAAADCLPPATDPATATCISGVDGKAIAAVNKLCGDVGAAPDNCGSPYPDGASWVNLVDIAISGNVPGNFCE